MQQTKTPLVSPRMAVSEVAELLGCSQEQVRRLAKRREILPIAGGGRGSDLWFNREEMEAYAAGGAEALKRFPRYATASG